MSSIADDGIPPRVSTCHNADIICYYVALGVSTLFFVGSLASVLIVYAFDYPLSSSVQFLILTVAGNFVTSTASSFLVLYRRKYRDNSASGSQESDSEELVCAPHRHNVLIRIAQGGVPSGMRRPFPRQTVTPPPPYDESELFVRHNQRSSPPTLVSRPIVGPVSVHARQSCRPTDRHRTDSNLNRPVIGTAFDIRNGAFAAERSHSAPFELPIHPRRDVPRTCTVTSSSMRSSSVPLNSSHPQTTGAAASSASFQRPKRPGESATISVVNPNCRLQLPSVRSGSTDSNESLQSSRGLSASFKWQKRPVETPQNHLAMQSSSVASKRHLQLNGAALSASLEWPERAGESPGVNPTCRQSLLRSGLVPSNDSLQSTGAMSSDSFERPKRPGETRSDVSPICMEPSSMRSSSILLNKHLSQTGAASNRSFEWPKHPAKATMTQEVNASYGLPSLRSSSVPENESKSTATSFEWPNRYGEDTPGTTSHGLAARPKDAGKNCADPTSGAPTLISRDISVRPKETALHQNIRE